MMAATRIDLDSGGRHYLLLEADAGFRISLHHGLTHRHSILHEAFKRHLLLRLDGVDHQFSAGADAIVLPAGEILEVILGGTTPLSLAHVALNDPPWIVGPRYVLSPFESRYLADTGRPHPAPGLAGPLRQAQDRADGAGLVTDLHVHFAGCVSPADLVQIGTEAGVRYPAALLAEIGIHVEAQRDVLLADLPREFLEQLESWLSIPLDRRVPFVGMEQIYNLRRPITKHPAAFVPLLRRIAADYAAMGARYVELSLSDVVGKAWLTAVHREVPAIEREFGVELRFLAAMGRHDDLEWDLDYIERVRSLAASRYLVGVDVMGQETNSTRQFARQIREVAAWADQARPGFAIRVHAGENPAHPENVRVAVECTEGLDVQLRIGHGLYGVDDATLDRLKAAGTIVEFNLNSNFALNNIQSSVDAPIVRYVRHGVPVVLGTDGYGIYQTTLGLEARAARLCGLADADFELLRQTEARYLQRRRDCDAMATVEPTVYAVPDDLPPCHYVPEILQRKAQALRERDQTLLDRLSQIGVPLLSVADVTSQFRGKQCICFGGAWKTSWQAISPENQELVRSELSKLLNGLLPHDVLLITGGTCFGVEGIVQQLAVPLGFTVLGAIVRQTPPDSLHGGAVTHACIVGGSLYDKAAGLYKLMKDLNGLCLFIGGGAIVNDEIQTAVNLRLRYLLMDGPEGAAAQHARQQPHNSFRTAEQVLARMSQSTSWGGANDPYWHLGANPTVDIVLTRRRPGSGALQVLLIRRDADAATEGGKWALPGGFQQTNAPRGTAWRRDVESAPEACIRELREETGLDLSGLAAQLHHVGDYEGNGRDPRDTPQAWSRSEVFGLHLPDALAGLPLCGGDDASDARWFDIDAVPKDLAFDHARILADGLACIPGAASQS